MARFTHNPGSDKAIEKGCRCPRLDNARGKGYMCQKGIFVIRQDCPLHSKKKETNAR